MWIFEQILDLIMLVVMFIFQPIKEKPLILFLILFSLFIFFMVFNYNVLPIYFSPLTTFVFICLFLFDLLAFFIFKNNYYAQVLIGAISLFVGFLILFI